MHKQIPSVTFTTQGALRKSALRQANERLVLNAIRENPQLSRVEISRITGLSPSSVTFIVKRLSKDKLIREKKVFEAGTSNVGRPPTSLNLAPGARFAVGVDLSPRESRVALADWRGEILEQHSVEPAEDPAEMLRNLHVAVRSFVTGKPAHRVLGVGVSVPGTWDPKTRTLTTAVSLGWQDVAVAPVLEKGLDVPMHFDNNANLSALGEQWFRSQGARPLENFIFVTLESGIGTGIMFSGQMIQGAFGRAGEFGHTALVPDGRPCLCGSRGCWEEYASDRALLRSHFERTGQNLTAAQIIDLARTGDPAATGTIEEASRYLALGLANLVVGLNPEALIIDNWCAAGWDMVERLLWQTLRQRVPASWLEGLRIYPSAHAENAALFGAVALALSRFFHSFDHEGDSGTRNSVQMRG